MAAPIRIMAQFKNASYLQSSTTFLLFFASWGIWWSFFQIWLTDSDQGLGLNGAQVGTVYSVNSVATLTLMLFYGTLQDKLDTKRTLVATAAVVMTLIGPFAIWVYRPLLESSFMLGVTLGAVVLSAGFLASAGLFEVLSERLSRRYGYEYGQARMWGSFGYAVVALFAGFLFTVDPELNFWLGSVFGLACLLVILLWRPPAGGREAGSVAEAVQMTPSLREMIGVFRMPHLWLLVVFVFLSWTFYGVFDGQMFPEFYTLLFETPAQGQQVYGVLNSAQVFLEAAMMGLVPLIMRKLGVRTTLMLGILVMFLRILGCAVFEDPYVISFVKMFHAPEVALCVLPILRYFTLHFNPALSATLYLVGFQISGQIGSVILSPILGSLRDAIGYQPTFYVIAGVVFVAGIYGLLVLKRDDQDVQGEPFLRDRDRRAREAEEAPART
ncbi:MFS transporter [Rothia sp. AR01]|uniref:MFS transporter n=1 Tax=Rothia santali TaxID=2949643 RepID=A0A9X2HDM1_9MICC|nr:MFS transporter [Rothia santali]MCP3426345.1 MFS transporter [Rothia santali]